MKTPRLPLAALAALIASTAVAYTQTAPAQTDLAQPAATSGDAAGNNESTIQMLEDAIKKLEDAADSSTVTNQSGSDAGAAPAAAIPAEPASAPATQPTTAQPADTKAGDAAEASKPAGLDDQDTADAVDPVIIMDDDGVDQADTDASAPEEDASTAAAQQQPATGATPATAPLVQIDDANVVVSPLDLPVGKLKGMDVQSPDGNKISTVKEVLGTPDGKPMAIAVDLGGFLGIGAKEVVIPVETLKLSEDKLAVSLSKEQMAALPIDN